MTQGIYTRPLRPVIFPVGPSIAYIQLTRGQFALIDSGDATLLGQWNWCARWSAAVQGFYAGRKERTAPKTYQMVTMHRLLINPPPGKFSDHINRNTLDNRGANLREATPLQNLVNRGRQRNNKSGYKGVSWDASKKNYVSQIRHQGKTTKLWRGQDPKVGHLVYCEAATRLHGEFARTA